MHSLVEIEGKKIAVLMEADYYEPEIWYYARRFPEEGAEVAVRVGVVGGDRERLPVVAGRVGVPGLAEQEDAGQHRGTVHRRTVEAGHAERPDVGLDLLERRDDHRGDDETVCRTHCVSGIFWR